MEKFLLCGEISNSREEEQDDDDGGELGVSGRVKLYKGRRRGTVEFCGIWKHNKAMKELVASGVKILHTLDHCNVLVFYEWYETPKHIWVITELASGGTLAEILEQDGAIPQDKVGGFVKDISSGLNYLHCNGILYCDLRPQKVVLDTCDCLKLSDFCLAQSSQDPSPDTNQQPTFLSDARVWFQTEQQSKDRSKTEPKVAKREHRIPVGWSSPAPPTTDYLTSPFYAAPELFAGSVFSVATDMWSLGCVVFELLVGRQPFCAGSLGTLQEMVCDSDAVATSQGKELGVWSELLDSLLAKEPHARCSWAKFSSQLPPKN